jgi:hypothetical protein
VLERERHIDWQNEMASVVRASATPWPSTAASMSILAWFSAGPRRVGAETPAASNHFDQVAQPSKRSSGSSNSQTPA